MQFRIRRLLAGAAYPFQERFSVFPDVHDVFHQGLPANGNERKPKVKHK
jgi:hypothetical protein